MELWINQRAQFSDGKLRTYTSIKQHFGYERYPSINKNFEHRRSLTKLRTSAHRLNIEAGRYQGIPPHQRLCAQCDSREIEDEIDFLLVCNKFADNRQALLNTVALTCNNSLNLTVQEKFHWIMNCEDKNILKELCNFIYKFCR